MSNSGRRGRPTGPRYGRNSETNTSASNLSATSKTYSLNRRHRSGSITSFHFHPARNGLYAQELDSRQMGHVEHYSATDNTKKRTRARTTDHQLVSEINRENRFSSDTFRNSSPRGDAGSAHRARNKPTEAGLDQGMDEYWSKMRSETKTRE